MKYEIVSRGTETRLGIVEANGEHEAIEKYIAEGGVCNIQFFARPWISPEELADFKAWLPSKEQADEYFRQFPVDMK